MRLRSAVTLLLVALLTAPPFSLSGQEEPLPIVVARATPLTDLPLVVLAVEPLRDFHQPSLLDAARANDYPTFDALYREAKARGESLGAYDTLHELWTYSVTDPIGAFYGAEFYQRLARVYPGYARFIDEYRIVDDHGAVFYPTSETRAFLLERMVEGNAPRALLADAAAARTRPSAASQTAATPQRARENRRATAPETAKTGVKAASTTKSASSRDGRQNAGGPAGRKTGAPVKTAAPIPATAQVATTGTSSSVPVATTPTPVAATAPPVASVPAPVVDTPPVVETPAEPVPAPAVTDAAPAVPAPATVRDNGFATRGILLLVLGVIGIGLLAVMLRASESKPPVSIISPEKPVTPFEPVKRPAATGPQAAAPPPPKDDKNRATGSHG
ncbi:MAG TPA: hypothetical protein VEK57_28100 [Thermoanaerobaculia bacterium]|nr:hypothetical protein [Thermoanaerobaculia bacterium]